MRLTYWNADQNAYEAPFYEDNRLNFREEGESCLNNGVIISPSRLFVSGFVIDALAKYENTGLTPNEINELQGETLKKLKKSNEILRKNNDKYYIAYQKLLDENRILKSLLKGVLKSLL